ncbi:unnamed protein product [Darwinula stevensoni]|uniref:Copper transport protein n=1 Tax=Darwinula stevensoni TaxID=69355 RepID=A0A7R9AGU8_9CRUS|nr:unnamed protein product [Darwinula stevensoni]CAG0904689.1 unnamed protein product [Darwinula stevensoni]
MEGHHMHHGSMMNSSDMLSLPMMNATTMMNSSQASGCKGCHTMDHGHSHSMQRESHDGHTGMSMDMMPMYFHFSKSATILFEKWAINNAGGLIGSMIAIFLMAVIYEGLKYYRDYLFRRASNAIVGSVSSTDSKGIIVQPASSAETRMLGQHHLLQTLLHVIQITLSYFLMLIFMTYNAWLCIAVVLGAGVGYFIFGWRKSIVVDITEHCH